MAQVTRVSTCPGEAPGSARLIARLTTPVPVEELRPTGPVERFMSAFIRKLSWSRLSEPGVAMSVAGVGLLLGMIVGATATNAETLPYIHLPLSHLPALTSDFVARALLYSGDVLSCLGLAGMLWAHSQGWRPNPRHLFYASAIIVTIMVNLTPVGSSDTASYAAYGRIASMGGNPYTVHPVHWLGGGSPYVELIGRLWRRQVSVYGPLATVVQSFAGSIGGHQAWVTVWVLMILNGAVFLGVGWLLLKTSDDPVRATLFWTANPVLIQQLVGGGHLDTLVAAAAIGAIQVARKVAGSWGDVLAGVLIGIGCAVKISAVLIGVGLALPLLWRREFARTARMTGAAVATLVLLYSPYLLQPPWTASLNPLFRGSKWVTLPSPTWILYEIGKHHHLQATMAGVISVVWITAMIVVAWLVYHRISADQPREVVVPFALTYAWLVTAPWVFAWYTAVAWVLLTQVPRNRMTRWLAIVTVVYALWHSSGGWVPPGRI